MMPVKGFYNSDEVAVNDRANIPEQSITGFYCCVFNGNIIFTDLPELYEYCFSYGSGSCF
jgi:hypothetical protein